MTKCCSDNKISNLIAQQQAKNELIKSRSKFTIQTEQSKLAIWNEDHVEALKLECWNYRLSKNHCISNVFVENKLVVLKQMGAANYINTIVNSNSIRKLISRVATSEIVFKQQNVWIPKADKKKLFLKTIANNDAINTVISEPTKTADDAHSSTTK